MTIRFAVKVKKQWIESFSYCPSGVSLQKQWEKTKGVRFAPAVFAILGEVPFIWEDSRDSAWFVARACKGKVYRLKKAWRIR